MTKQLLKALLLLAALLATALATQARPDLIVSSAMITRDGMYVSNITVTVTNACRQSSARASYVLVTFKQGSQPGAKPIYFIGNTVKALKGGESQSQTFDVSNKKIEVGRYIYIETDPYKKVAEASEDNNWRSLFPDAFGNSTVRCSE
ncbi:MAG TPA: CARDB domain-containing protein [Pyrinomonadaceae bacterium]|nr:CARDB domain-containing protein [Pyrinomonadaceae bacterium]